MGTTGGVSYVSLRPTKFYHEYPRYSEKEAMLSDPNVYDFDEDEERNIWIATSNGLNQWDRKRYTVYKQDIEVGKKLKRSRVNHFTSIIHELDGKKIYLGT